MKQSKAVASVLVGNTMEFYDFIVFAFMSKYISSVFFPNEDIMLSYMATFVVFASGYLMRPIGGLFFGYVGDRYGRKSSLSYSVLIITISTLLMGFLPTYKDAGIIAPILLTLCRLLQGFSASGEQSGAAVYLSESSDKNKAYSGSLVLGSTYFGVLLGSATCLALSLMFTVDQISEYAWRIPFILSVCLGIPSLIMRRNLEENKSFLVNEKKYNPIAELFKTSLTGIMFDTVMVASLSVPIYMFTVFMPSYLMISVNIPATVSQIISVVSLMFLSVSVPVLGRIADRTGIEKIYSIGCIYNILLSYPIFLLLSSSNYMLTCAGVSLLGIGLLFIASTMFAVLIERYKSSVRYTAVSFIFNTSMSIFGSLTPLVAFYLIRQSGKIHMPWILLCMSGIVGLIFFRLKPSAVYGKRGSNDKSVSISGIA